MLGGMDPLACSPGVIKTADRGGFNRSMQHLKFCMSRRSVANEEKNTDFVHREPEGSDVGPLEEG
jgi:hypothetical protein